MNKRIYLLMIVAFIVGLVELMIGGILDLISIDLQVSLGQAGFLMTIFSLIFAVMGPILLGATSHIERKRLTQYSLVIFFIGNIITILSATYTGVFVGRVLTALSSALLINLCLVIAPTMVEKRYRGRAIGIISMGISGALVLGLPIGLVLGETFNWRTPFIIIAILSLLLMIGIHYGMERTLPEKAVPLRKQLLTLKNQKILLAHIATFVFLAGHYTFYAYLKPFVQTTMGIEGPFVSVIYFIFGVAAVSGGGLGGFFSDRFGTNRTMLTVISIFIVTLFIMPTITFSVGLFLLLTIVWGMVNWALSPAMQSYLIDIAPEVAGIQQSLHNSALHLGIAFGSFTGGIVIEQATVVHNAYTGGILMVLSLIIMILSLMSQIKKGNQHSY